MFIKFIRVLSRNLVKMKSDLKKKTMVIVVVVVECWIKMKICGIITTRKVTDSRFRGTLQADQKRYSKLNS